MSENLLPWQRSDLWEPVFFVIWVHGLYLFFRWSSQNFDDLDELVNTAFTWENWLTQHEFSDNTADGPNINICSVIRITENKLRSPVVSRTYVGNVWLSKDELLCTTEVTKLEHVGLHITENVLWLDISVTNALGVNICDGSHQLVGIKLHNQVWNLLLHFEVLFHYSIGSVGNEVHDDVKIDFFGLITIGIEALSHFDAVWMMEHLQNC